MRKRATTTGARPQVLVVALSLIALTVAVLQTAVVPVLSVIAEQLNASTVAVSWAVTGNLLAAAANQKILLQNLAPGTYIYRVRGSVTKSVDFTIKSSQ